MRLTQRLVRLAQRVRGFSELVGGGFARGFGLADFVQNFVAPVRDLGGQFGGGGQLRLDAGQPLVEARHLRVGALGALQPAQALLADGLQTGLPPANVAFDAFQRRLRPSVSVTLGGGLLLEPVKLGFSVAHRPRGGKRLLRRFARGFGFLASVGGALASFLLALQLVRLLQCGTLRLTESGALLRQRRLR